MRPRARVLFVSCAPETRGHTYRVVHHVSALRVAGMEASWMPLSEAIRANVDDLDVVVAFRAVWNSEWESLLGRCRTGGTSFGFDVDDLLFDSRIMMVEYFDYLRSLTEDERNVWMRDIEGYHQTLMRSDFALVSTSPLAEAVRTLGKPAYVLSNGVDAAMIAKADAALAASDGRSSAVTSRVRLGYASGTPTHQKDFAVVAPVLAVLLDERPELELTVVGFLDMEEFPSLYRHRGRIELRSHVPHLELFQEYARFDINLAPLQCGNPFCESKSELKYFEAALVAVPTVAAATTPYRAAIQNGETGFCARSPEEWRDSLLTLLSSAEERARIGRNARRHAIATFGPEAQSAAASKTFAAIIGNARDLRIQKT